jgi:methylated-DNA-[protein]-cysteine S-methyltransferase
MEHEYTAYMQSPAGRVQIKADDKNITAIRFIKDTENVLFPDDNDDNDSSLPNLPEHLKQCIVELNEYFAGSRRDFSVPLRQNGTEFQLKVWQLLRKIPYGKTASYLDIARMMGNERLTRAVGRANGKNKIWIMIPCHRIIGTNGSLTGYAGGAECKRFLLELEKGQEKELEKGNEKKPSEE